MYIFVGFITITKTPLFLSFYQIKTMAFVYCKTPCAAGQRPVHYGIQMFGKLLELLHINSGRKIFNKIFSLRI